MLFYKNLRSVTDNRLLGFLKIRKCDICHKRFISGETVRLIAEFTECKENLVWKTVSKYKFIHSLSEEEIKLRLQTIKDVVGLSSYKSIKTVPLLKESPLTIKHRAFILEEAGFCNDIITPLVLTKYIFLTKTSAAFLKENGFIENNVDVLKNMLSYVDLDERFHPKSEGDIGNISVFKFAVLREYLKHKLHFPDCREADKFVKEKLKHKSLRILSENIDIFINQIGLSPDKVGRNLFILLANPENLKRMIQEVKEIGGVNALTYFQKNPRILISKVDNLKLVIKHIKDSGIPESYIAFTGKILTVKSDTLKYRLDQLKNNEYFSICLHLPTALELVYYHEKFYKRIKLLNDLKVNYISVQTLAGAENRFQKFYENGGEKCSKRHILIYLSKELSCDETKLEKSLSKNRFWLNVPIVSLYKNLNYLKTLFSIDQILKNVVILIYPQKKILKEMESLESKEELYPYKGIDGKLKQDMILPLVIYYIEKENNFSPEAVWDLDSDTMSTDVPTHFDQIKTSVSDARV